MTMNENNTQLLDIKDFQLVSSADGKDYILLVQNSGMNGKISITLFKRSIAGDITPSIQKGIWYIGAENTGVDAVGKTPELRKGTTGIEWKYTDSQDWKTLVSMQDILIRFEDLTPEQVDSLKLKLADLTESDIATLQKPARDIAEKVEKNEAERVI